MRRRPLVCVCSCSHRYLRLFWVSGLSVGNAGCEVWLHTWDARTGAELHAPYGRAMGTFGGKGRRARSAWFAYEKCRVAIAAQGSMLDVLASKLA